MPRYRRLVQLDADFSQYFLPETPVQRVHLAHTDSQMRTTPQRGPLQRQKWTMNFINALVATTISLQRVRSVHTFSNEYYTVKRSAAKNR